MLQDCFHHTDWDVFKGQGMDTRESLDEYTSTVLCYINFCVDNVTSWKHFRVYLNRKPWITHEVEQLIQARNRALGSKDHDLQQSQGCIKERNQHCQTTTPEAY